MEQYILYLAIKYIIESINSDYSIKYNDIDKLKNNSIGIYIKSGIVPNYRTLSDAEYSNNISRVQILFQFNNEAANILQALSDIQKVKNTLDTTFNLYYNTDNPEYNNILIIKTNNLGGIDYLGKNNQDLNKYTLNYEVTFNLTEV